MDYFFRNHVTLKWFKFSMQGQVKRHSLHLIIITVNDKEISIVIEDEKNELFVYTSDVDYVLYYIVPI